MDDATYKDTSGKATMTASETDKVTAALSNTGSTFKKINAVQLKKFLNLQESRHHMHKSLQLHLHLIHQANYCMQLMH